MRYKTIKLGAFTLMFILLTGACSYKTDPSSVQSDSVESSSVAQNDVQTGNQHKEFISVGSEASCEQVELRDSGGNKIDVPEDVGQALDCVSGGVALSPDNKYLLYNFSDPNTDYVDLKLYNFAAKNSAKLMSFNKTLDGLQCLWHDDSQIIACVVVNQEEYEGLTKIFVITIDKNGALVKKENFPQAVGETVDFMCGASCYPGKFWFEDQNTLKYEGHKLISPGVRAVKF